VIVGQELFTLELIEGKETRPHRSWDKAISDAQELIEGFESEIAGLRQSIRMLADLKRSGARFPSENKSEAS